MLRVEDLEIGVSGLGLGFTVKGSVFTVYRPRLEDLVSLLEHFV